jgi:hypothetical protein
VKRSSPVWTGHLAAISSEVMACGSRPFLSLFALGAGGFAAFVLVDAAPSRVLDVGVGGLFAVLGLQLGGGFGFHDSLLPICFKYGRGS